MERHRKFCPTPRNPTLYGTRALADKMQFVAVVTPACSNGRLSIPCDSSHGESAKEHFVADPKHDEKRDEKQDDSFRVVDRRLFTSEGELRPEAAEEQRREKAKPPQPAAKTEKAATPAAPAAEESKPATKADKNFQLLIDLLARNAAALMGGIPDPATGQAYLDLEGAHEMIDMLDMLRDKTRGNLAPEEESLLSEVVGSLKLSYLEVSKAAANAMREGAKGAR